MSDKEFQNLIGKHISVVKHLLENEFENEFFGKYFYYSSSIDKSYYGMRYNNITIITDEKDTISEITIHLKGVINKSFYDKFITDYGKPDTIKVAYDKQVINESESNDKPIERFDDDLPFVQHMKQGIIKTREGKFEENPLYMLWNYKDYQIKIFIRREQNISEVIFRVPTKHF